MPDIVRQPEMTLADFAVFLKERCHGDWWDKVLPVTPDPEHGLCECCTWHPLTEKHASILNRIFGVVKDAGGPSPTSAYTHCWGELIIEWYSEDHQNSVILDITDKWGWDAMVWSPATPTYFVSIIDNREAGHAEK